MKLDKSFCCMFLSVFLALTVHKARFFFAKITNQIFRLNYAQLICEAAENKRLCTVTVNSTSIATTLFSLLEISRINYDVIEKRVVKNEKFASLFNYLSPLWTWL